MPILGARIPVAAIVGRRIAYLFRDDFTIDDAAPLTDPLPADKVGTWDIKADTGNNWSISSGRLQAAGAAGANDPLMASTTTFARAAGLALFHVMRMITPSDSQRPMVGWDTSDAGVPLDHSWIPLATSMRIYENAIVMSVGTYTLDTDHKQWIIQRSTGAFFGTDNQLLYVSAVGALTPNYIVIGEPLATTGNNSIDTARVTQLGGAWLDDYGIATSRLAGSRSAGDTFTHTADVFLEFTVTTLPSAGQIELWFRIQDATNYWSVTVDSTGALDLDEVVAGVPTERGTAAGVVGAGERICVRAIGSEIRVFDAAALRITYSSASNFQTETDGELDTEGTGGAVDDIVAYPVDHNFTQYFKGA